MNCVQDLKLKPWDGSPARVVGRYRNNAGRLTDGIFLGDGVLPIGKRLDLAQLAQDTRDFAEKFPRHTATPLAIVGVAFGAPFSRDLNYRLWKGDWVEQDHPREPDGTPQGGEFAPKDGQVSDEAANGATDSAINQTTIFKDLNAKMQKRIARKVLKNRLVAALRTILGIAADAIPVVGEIVDVYEIAQTVIDASALESEISAAKAFVEEGPHELEALRASAEDRSFSSPEAFKKDCFGKFYGPAGDGWDYHHIVWKGGPNGANLSAETLNSTENMIRVPRLLHEEITDAYRTPAVKWRETGAEDTKESLRQWLDKQPYDVQREYGLKVMRNLGVIK